MHLPARHPPASHRGPSCLPRTATAAADTNAAIVGGLLGALHGASAIPSSLLSTVEAGCWDEWTAKGHQRPEKLWGSQLRPLATRLYEEAAANAEQTGGASSA